MLIVGSSFHLQNIHRFPTSTTLSLSVITISFTRFARSIRAAHAITFFPFRLLLFFIYIFMQCSTLNTRLSLCVSVKNRWRAINEMKTVKWCVKFHIGWDTRVKQMRLVSLVFILKRTVVVLTISYFSAV